MALETDTHYIGHSLLVRPTPTHSQHTLTIGPSAFSASARYGQRCLRQGSAQITSLYRLLAVTCLLARPSNTTRRRRADCHPFSHHTHAETGRSSLEQQAVSFFLHLLSSKLFRVCQMGDFLWKELSGEGPEVVVSQAGREQGGSPGRASPRRTLQRLVWPPQRCFSSSLRAAGTM